MVVAVVADVFGAAAAGVGAALLVVCGSGAGVWGGAYGWCVGGAYGW